MALRRIRSAVRTFADAFDDSESTALVEAAAWYADGLGRLRDLDILEARVNGSRARIDSALVVGEVWSWLEEAISEERGRRRMGMIESLSGESAAGFRALLAQWAAAPPWGEDLDQVQLRRLVHRADRQWRRRLDQAISMAHDDADGVSSELAARFHRAGKAAKRARYALDVIAPALSDRPTRRLAELKAVQDQLVIIQDAAVSMQAMVAFGERIGRRSGRNAFTLGVLAALEQSSQRTAIEALVIYQNDGGRELAVLTGISGRRVEQIHNCRDGLLRNRNLDGGHGQAGP